MNELLNKELDRYRSLYKYNFIVEQVDPNQEETPVDPTVDAPPTDVPNDPTVDPTTTDTGSTEPTLDSQMSTEDGTEEIDITDLVNMTKSIKNDFEQTKTNSDVTSGKVDTIFSKLDDLEKKLSDMDNIVSKIEQLGSKIEQMKPPTPEERLEMRSLDSFPFNQTPKQFFANKEQEMAKSGKNKYIFTKDEMENLNINDIKNSFNPNYND